MPNSFSHEKRLKPWQDNVIIVALMAVGMFINALVINAMFIPHQFLSGGLSGLALLLGLVSGLPVWLLLLILTIPVTILAFIKLPRKFAILSTCAQLLNSLFLNLTENINFGIQDPVVAAVIGGAATAFMSAMVVRRGASFGGIDIITYLLSKKFSISMGVFGIAFNAIVVLVFSTFKGLELALITIISMAVSSVVFTAAVQGFNRTKTVFIISEKWEQIAPHIMNRLQRGVTFLSGEGAYTGEARKVVYCIVRTVELATAKSIVMEHDPKAYFSVIDTKEVIGRGFGAM